MEESGLGLLADVGRQSVRFALVREGSRTPQQVRSYNTSDHPTFTASMQAYLRDNGLHSARMRSAIAVAGVARGDAINVSHGRWFISLSGVESVLRHRPIALNDFAANAYALTTLDPQDMRALAGPPIRPPRAGGSYLVVGPGTGLGVAGLVTAADGRLHAVPSEAGHSTFHPEGADEQRLFDHLHRLHAHVTAEQLLSGEGLVAACRALGAAAGQFSTPEEVTAASGRDPFARAAVMLFAEYLGAFVGDMVLAFGAWDGVFLTGPIVRELRGILERSAFRSRLEKRGGHSRRMAEVPVATVHQSNLELVGAAAALAAAQA